MNKTRANTSLVDTSKIDGVILAGGLGTRLRAVIADRPKVLAPILGRAWITYLLDQLAAAGVRRAIICTGYKGRMVEEELGRSYKGIELVYSRESSPLGTGGALELAAPLIQSEIFLALNGDSYCEVNIGEYLAWHFARAADVSMVLTQVSDASRYGKVTVEGDGRISGFEEKSASRGGGWVNAGIYIINRHLLDDSKAPVKRSLEREIFPSWVMGRFFGYPASKGTFIDIGTPESYQVAEKIFSERIGG